MYVNNKILYIVIGVLSVGIIILFLLLLQRPPQAATTRTVYQPTTRSGIPTIAAGTQQRPTVLPTVAIPNTPEQVSGAFYNWYIEYHGNAYAAGAYKQSPYLSDQFKEIIASFPPFDGSHDPVMCTSNKIPNVITQKASVPNQIGRVNVMIQEELENRGGRNLYRFVLQYINGKWVIIDIICQN